MSNSTNESSISAPAAEVIIRVLQPGEDATAFRVLNEEWITHYYELEELDRAILGDPERHIFARGGHILFADVAGEPAGTVALIPQADGSCELSKMAVAPGMRGLGIGRKLILEAIELARKIGCTSLFLGSGKKLHSAVHLYESVGFQHVPPSALPGIHYDRADVFMKMQL
jgi:putative acetyltransferase